MTNHLAECLAARATSKSQLAFRLHMSRAYVTRLVRGDVRPSIGVALRLARYFGKPVEEIFQLVEEGTTKQAISRPVSAVSGNTGNKQQKTKG